jgi:hypothetical protein
MQEFEFLYSGRFSRESFKVMKSIFLSLFFVEMFVVVNLRIDVHDDDKVGLGGVSDGDTNNVLSMDVDKVLNDLWMLVKLIGPDGFLLVGFDVFEDDGSAREVNEFRIGNE